MHEKTNNDIFLSHFIQKYQPEQFINAIGLQCPLPLLKLKQGLHHCQNEQTIYIITNDKNSPIDIQRFCNKAGHELQITEITDDLCHLLIKKNSEHET